MGSQKIYSYTILIVVALFSFFHSQSLHNACLHGWAQHVLQHMSLREKIGQLCIVAISFSDDTKEALASTNKSMKFPYMQRAYVEQLITNYQVGGVIFLRRSTVPQQVQLTNELQKMSKLPLLVMQDLEWGLAMRLDNTIKFPRNLTLGAVRNEELIYLMAKEIGRQCKAIGVHMNLAPVIDINTNPLNPVISDRSFGQDKEKVARLGLLYMHGLQDAGILACAKHFPGHGDTETDSHVAIAQVRHTKKHLQTIELYPFKKLIEQGVAAIMNGHLKVPAYDVQNIATVSPAIVTDLLQKKLGFRGLILTDALNMGALAQFTPEEVAVRAIQAGNDLLVLPVDVPKTIASIEAAVHAGVLSEDEIDTHVLKVLQAKEALQLAEHRLVPVESVQKIITTEYALNLKKRLYQEAITVVGPSIHSSRKLRTLGVSGKVPARGECFSNLREKNVSNHAGLCVVQIGGKKHSAFMHTLCAQRMCMPHYCSASMSKKDAEAAAKKLQACDTIVISVFDMNKFAMKTFGISAGTLALLQQLRQHKKKIVVVLFGSPYSVQLFDAHDSLVVAYEDDPDAQEAAAHVVAGTRRAVGQLPV